MYKMHLTCIRPNTQRHDAFDGFLFHDIFYVILHFKINIKFQIYLAARKQYQDEDQDFQNTVSRPRPKSRELHVWC